MRGAGDRLGVRDWPANPRFGGAEGGLHYLARQADGVTVPTARPPKPRYPDVDAAKAIKLTRRGVVPVPNSDNSEISRETAAYEPTRARLAGLGAAGVWLLVIIVSAVLLALIIFSASQFQSRLAGLTLNGGPMTIWKAEPLLDRWIGARALADAAANSLAKSREAKADIVQKTTGALTTEAEAGLSARQAHLELINRVAILNADLAAELRSAGGIDIDVVNKVRTGPLSILAKTNVNIQKALDHFVEEFERWKYTDGVLQGVISQGSRWDDIIHDRQKEFIEASERADQVVPKGQNLDDAQRASLENAIYEFQAVRNLLWGVVYKFSLLPSDFLILILVIEMGVLGSTMQLSYIYSNEFGDRNISFYIIRPFFGVLTALVVFIVVKAGVPLMADASKIGGVVPINPYLIAFLGIISGLMSERAIEAFRQWGEGYFRGKDEQPARWARQDLRQYLSEENRDLSVLKSILRADDDQLNRWLDGTDIVPSEAQRIIAAVLNRPVRDLFTEMPA